MAAAFRRLLAQRFWLLVTERDDDGGGGRCQIVSRPYQRQEVGRAEVCVM